MYTFTSTSVCRHHVYMGCLKFIWKASSESLGEGLLSFRSSFLLTISLNQTGFCPVLGSAIPSCLMYRYPKERTVDPHSQLLVAPQWHLGTQDARNHTIYPRSHCFSLGEMQVGPASWTVFCLLWAACWQHWGIPEARERRSSTPLCFSQEQHGQAFALLLYLSSPWHHRTHYCESFSPASDSNPTVPIPAAFLGAFTVCHMLSTFLYRTGT